MNQSHWSHFSLEVFRNFEFWVCWNPGHEMFLMCLFSEVAVDRAQWCDIGVLRGRCVHVFCTPLRFNPLCMIGKKLTNIDGRKKQLRWHIDMRFFSANDPDEGEQPFPWFVWETYQLLLWRETICGWAYPKNPINQWDVGVAIFEATNSVGFSKDLSISWRNHLWLLYFPHLCEDAFWSKIGLSVSKIRCVRTWIKCTYLVRSPVHVQAVMFRVRIRKRSFWMFWRARFPPWTIAIGGRVFDKWGMLSLWCFKCFKFIFCETCTPSFYWSNFDSSIMSYIHIFPRYSQMLNVWYIYLHLP